MVQTERFNLRLEKSVLQKLRALSKKRGITMSELVRLLILKET